MKENRNKSGVPSIVWSFIIVYLFYLATVSWVKILWNHQDSDVFFARVKFLMGLSFLASLIYIIGIYYLVGHTNVDPFYTLIITLILSYLGFGLMAYPFLQNK
ncbi:hypothetical protein GCM10027164_33620 [Algoriphagus taiwanensis]|uniref:Uncharacterized protein n=1 Tax=Algoriphagus taiwanensis TaxID=1445656 RepID=A0ABQ6Q3F6_9BACT|nr:hypothetical protein Ataiwa_18040 [Algoriphagus taiwanensis]